MNTVNSLKVNRESVQRIHRRSNGKKRFLKLVATTTALTIIVVGANLGIKKIKDNINQEQIQTIVQYYGEDSAEKKIIDYIGIAEKLHGLNLDKYSVSENLYVKHDITKYLLDPTTINNLIEEFKNIPSFVLSENISKQDRNIYLTLSLIKQEKLVNKYIYEKAYSTAHKNIASSTKKYAAETFGIEDPNDITLSYYNVGNGEHVLTVTNHKNGFNDERYNIDGFFDNEKEKKITEGVLSMINTDIQYDYNDNDDFEYNKDRNIYIKEALEKSVELEKNVNETNLYDSKLSGKLK